MTRSRIAGLARALGVVLICVAAPAAAQGQATMLSPVADPFSAPDFVLMDLDGKRHRLSEYRGKVVVLNFWATWCPPCRYEMPSLERARTMVKDGDIVILAVNVGEDPDTIFDFTGAYPVGFPLLIDESGDVVKRYPVTGLPTTFLIDPHGQVTHRAVGGREWDDPNILAALRVLAKTAQKK